MDNGLKSPENSANGKEDPSTRAKKKITHDWTFSTPITVQVGRKREGAKEDEDFPDFRAWQSCIRWCLLRIDRGRYAY